MKSRIVLLAALLASAPAVSQTGTSSSHCKAAEETVFSCSTGKKLISVCATGGGIQYRFGPAGAPEMIWPENPAQKNVVTRGTNMYAGGGAAYLRFAKGDTAYIVYSGEGKGWFKEGVAVEQGDRTIANVRCKGFATSRLEGALPTAIAEDTRGFDLP